MPEAMNILVKGQLAENNTANLQSKNNLTYISR
jgi:hypothetical protein